MATFDDKWDVEFSASKPTVSQNRRLGFFNFGGSTGTSSAFGNLGATTAPPMHVAEQSTGIVATVIEEARVLLDTSKLLGRLFGKDVSFPPFVESLVGALSFLPELASCELKAVEGGQTADMLTCPLKLGSQGFDMIHMFLRTLGIGKDYGESGVEKKSDAHDGDVGWSTPHKNSGGFFNKMFNR